MAVDINVYAREPGKNQNLKLRAEDKIPAILYGKNIKSTPICLSGKDTNRILMRHGTSAVYNVIINGSTFSAILKEIQKDPVTGNILHMDFQEVSLTEKLERNVPVTIKGAGFIENKGGIVQHQMRELPLVGLINDIPGDIELDVSNMNIGDTIFVKDIKLPDSVETKVDPDEVILSIIYSKVTDEELEGTGEEEEEEQPEDEGQEEE